MRKRKRKQGIDLGDFVECCTCNKRVCFCPERQPDKSWDTDIAKIENLLIDGIDDYNSCVESSERLDTLYNFAIDVRNYFREKFK